MKKAFLFLLMMAVCGNAFAQVEREHAEKTADYWVYVRLEDRSGVTTADDAGRSKAGDVVAVLPVTPQHIPSETEKKEWMIFKTSLTDEQVKTLTEPYLETKEAETKTIAYRKNKLDTSKLGVAVKKGLVAEKIDASKIETSVKTSSDLSKYELKRKFYAYVQRPAIRLANLIIPNAFAETVSTCNKSGEDYNTIALWEDAKDGDLVTARAQETLEVYNDDGTLTDKFTIDGSTTSADYYMKVTSPTGERHTGTAGTGAIWHSTDTYNAAEINDNYFVMEFLEITRTSGIPGATAGRYPIYIANVTGVTIRHCIIHDVDTNFSEVNAIQILDNLSAGNTINIINNIIYDITGTTAGGGIEVGQYNSVTVNIYNNTVYGLSGTGINCYGPYGDTDGNYVVINNISMGNGTDYSGTLDTNTDNLSTGATVTFTNTGAGTEDFHITSASTDAIDQGTDLSATFTTDIDGVTRSGTWDIGADEYVSYPFKQFNHGIMTGVF